MTNLALDIRTTTACTSLDDVAFQIAESAAYLGRSIVGFSKLTEVRSGKTGERLNWEARVQVIADDYSTPGDIREENYERMSTGMAYGPGQRIAVEYK